MEILQIMVLIIILNVEFMILIDIIHLQNETIDFPDLIP